MPGRKPLTARPTDMAYRYDGGLAGLYSCVHESVYRRELPLDIQAERLAQPSLLPFRHIETDREKAQRVREAIGRKISARALALVETVFLSCLAERELCILKFLLLGFAKGAPVTDMLSAPEVSVLLKAEQHLACERHLLTGFIRFSDYGGTLVATIRPKNFVLPSLAQHFMDRLPNERFMIYDKTHRAALIHQDQRAEIVELSEIILPEASETERFYRALWQQFYRTIAIEARHNPKCRLSHMPKRYWSEMTEMREYL